MVKPDKPGRIFVRTERLGAASDRVEVRILTDVQTAVRRFELRAYQAISIATPVDTGFARASWTPSVGPLGEGLGESPKSEDDARQAAAKLRPTNQAKAEALAKTYQVEAGRVFLTNPVPYIGPLNTGSSSQAPKKFVERAIMTAVQSLGAL